MKFKFSLPNIFLRIEGLVLLILSSIMFFNQNGIWIIYLALIFLPDIGMSGYFVNTKIGAVVYNLFHTTAIPATLLVIFFLTQQYSLLIFGFVWLAHIGIDRLMGYGLKYTDEFKHTHMQEV